MYIHVFDSIFRLNLFFLQQCWILKVGYRNGFIFQFIFQIIIHLWASQVALMVKDPPANEGDIRALSSIPGSERSPKGGHGNPLQYSCLENPMDRGAWWVIVHGVTKSWTQLKPLSTQPLCISSKFCLQIGEVFL